MGLFGWLFASRSRRTEPLHPDEQWFEPMQLTGQKAKPTPAAAIAMPSDIIAIDYINASGTRRLRRIRPLLGSPTNMLTAIDIDAERVRTFRLDRIQHARTNLGADIIDIRRHLADRHNIINEAFIDRANIKSQALDMLRRMLSQICIMRLVAEADGPITDAEAAVLLKYIKRDNGFAVRSDFVQPGDKRDIWPILVRCAMQIEITPGDLRAFMGTVFDDWENPRRFSAMSQCLSEMANLTANIDPSVIRLVETINNYRQ